MASIQERHHDQEHPANAELTYIVAPAPWHGQGIACKNYDTVLVVAKRFIDSGNGPVTVYRWTETITRFED